MLNKVLKSRGVAKDLRLFATFGVKHIVPFDWYGMIRSVAIWKFFIVAECKAGKSCDKQAIDQ